MYGVCFCEINNIHDLKCQSGKNGNGRVTFLGDFASSSTPLSDEASVIVIYL